MFPPGEQALNPIKKQLLLSTYVTIAPTDLSCHAGHYCQLQGSPLGKTVDAPLDVSIIFQICEADSKEGAILSLSS